MPLNPNEHWRCQTCSLYFPNERELRRHIEAFQSRARHLFDELQKCLTHFDSKVSNDEDCEASDDDRSDGLVNDDDNGKKFLCPHLECEGKPKTPFTTWKNFARHYTIHVECDETCAFCSHQTYRVRKYVTHFYECKARKSQGNADTSKEVATIDRLTALRKIASNELRRKCKTTSDEPELEISNTTNASDEEISFQEISNGYFEGIHRKRALEMADSDPEILHQPRKRRIANEDVVDATVADSFYQAPGTNDVVKEIGTLAHFGISSNDTLIPTHHRAEAPLPSHRDMDKSTTLSGNDGSFSTGRTDFLQYSLGSDEAFMGDEYKGTFTKAPLLFSHTMDGSSSYTGHEYEVATHARAPLLCSHTIDGSSSYTGHEYEVATHARAPLLCSHTIDGSSSYQNVCHYEASAQVRIPSTEYDTVDTVGRQQSNTLLTNEEMTALYGTSQTMQMLVPGAGGYG